MTSLRGTRPPLPSSPAKSCLLIYVHQHPQDGSPYHRGRVLGFWDSATSPDGWGVEPQGVPTESQTYPTFLYDSKTLPGYRSGEKGEIGLLSVRGPTGPGTPSLVTGVLPKDHSYRVRRSPPLRTRTGTPPSPPLSAPTPPGTVDVETRRVHTDDCRADTRCRPLPPVCPDDRRESEYHTHPPPAPQYSCPYPDPQRPFLVIHGPSCMRLPSRHRVDPVSGRGLPRGPLDESVH